MQLESRQGRATLDRVRAGRTGWYIRIALYGAVLVGVLLAIHGMRARIPQAFGLTPITVKALSVTYLSPDLSVRDSATTTRDISVAVRIVGRDSLGADVRLSQFTLVAGSERPRPFASDLLFGESGALHVARGDTILGVLLFTVPADATPDELWWNP